MGRRNDWDAVRMVADNIRAGDRSFGNLTKIPDLPTSGWEAIRELEEKGLVTVAGDRVEPTPAFSPWLAELQSEETERAIARQKATPKPWQVPAPAPQPGKPAEAVPAVIEPSSQPSTRTASVATKHRRPRVIRPDLSGVDEMCVSILDFMNHSGRLVTSSDLRRGLNACRKGEIYKHAFQKLQNLRAIKVEKEPGSPRQWVTLLEVPPKYEATRPKPKRRRHSPGSRRQTAWFQQLLAERELED